MLRDADVACCMCGHSLSPVCKKEKRNPPLDQRMVHTKPQYTEKPLMRDSRLSEPDDYNNFSLLLNGQTFDETRDCYPYSC